MEGDLVISASRRTDLPAFFSEWFMNRIRAGYCCVVNPYNLNQITRVSLKPEDADMFVFWTKNAEPLVTHLPELDGMGYKYYFQYTINGYSKELEPDLPVLEKCIDTFKRVSEHLGADKVIWRYDPIVLSNITQYDYHLRMIEKIAGILAGYTNQLVISVCDEYRAAKGRLDRFNIGYSSPDEESYEFQNAMADIAAIAKDKDIEIYSCAETLNLARFGINPGKCIDGEYIRKVFGLDVDSRKDKYQRLECGCVTSKDIGFYDSCIHGCNYCYATKSLSAARTNYEQNHFVDSPSMLGQYDCPSDEQTSGQKSLF